MVLTVVSQCHGRKYLVRTGGKALLVEEGGQGEQGGGGREKKEGGQGEDGKQRDARNGKDYALDFLEHQIHQVEHKRVETKGKKEDIGDCKFCSWGTGENA